MERNLPENLVGRIALNDDGIITRVNVTLSDWLGYEAAALIGQRIDLLLHGGALFYLQSQILPILKLQGHVNELYLSLRDQRGETVPFLINAARFTEAIVPSNDFALMRMQQRARLEDELLRAKKLAEQANDAKAKFLAMMSHELRTPLQTISLSNDQLLAEDYGSLNHEQKDLLRASESATTSLAELIDDILNYAQMQEGRVQFSLSDVLVDDAFNRAERLIEHRLRQAAMTYQRKSAPGSLKVRCDPRRLQQILLNLLNNALKFTPSGGSITLEARPSGGVAAIEVSDTGPGIPRDQLQRIFEPFVQLPTSIGSSQKAGIGLGLAISRDLAHAMGGHLQVRSEVGVGSTFTLSLPLVTKTVAHASE
jgi:signal transduction histidine kinase